MSHRTLILRAAALAAVLGAGATVRAAEPQQSVKPAYLQDAATAEAPARKPLMDLLDKVGLAEGMEANGISVGGHVAGSWTYNFDQPDTHANFGRSFDVDDQDPTLNQVDLFVDKAVTADGSKFDVGGRVEVIWGGDSRFIHSLGLFDHYGAFNVPSADDADSPDEQFDLNQAYLDLALPVGNGLKVRAGKFNTTLGYEVISPTGNLFYSHSFLFNYAIPLTHTGVMASYNLDDASSVYAAVTRGWDTSFEDDNDTLSYMVGYSTALSDQTKLFVNLISGPDQFDDNGNWRTVVDVIVSTTVGDDLTVAVNGDYGYERNSVTSVSGSDAQWYGVAGYASYALCREASLNVRAEYFNDQDGARLSAGVGGAQFAEATVGLSIRPFASDNFLSNLVIRPEFRWDWSDEDVFNGGDDDNQLTAAIDAYFTF